MTDTTILSKTQAWLTSFIIQHNICPFARHVHENDRIRYQIDASEAIADSLEVLIHECQYLDVHRETETTLLILSQVCQDFDDYLDFVAIAEDLLFEQGYEGIYQLASFHPDYCFADSDDSDPANYTNRSPYPMLHLIREASISLALEHYPHPEQIPENNIALTRQLGLAYLQGLCSLG